MQFLLNTGITLWIGDLQDTCFQWAMSTFLFHLLQVTQVSATSLLPDWHQDYYVVKLSIKYNILTGIAHLYKKGTRHTEEPWNWTGWVARWKRRTMWDPTDNRRKFVNNRYFMALRGNEVGQVSKNFQSNNKKYLKCSCVGFDSNNWVPVLCTTVGAEQLVGLPSLWWHRGPWQPVVHGRKGGSWWGLSPSNGQIQRRLFLSRKLLGKVPAHQRSQITHQSGEGKRLQKASLHFVHRWRQN